MLAENQSDFARDELGQERVTQGGKGPGLNAATLQPSAERGHGQIERLQ